MAGVGKRVVLLNSIKILLYAVLLWITSVTSASFNLKLPSGQTYWCGDLLEADLCPSAVLAVSTLCPRHLGSPPPPAWSPPSTSRVVIVAQPLALQGPQGTGLLSH